MRTFGKIIVGIVLVIFAVAFLFPLFYTVYNSLLPDQYVGSLVSPKYFTLDNFETIFLNYPVGQWFLNTIIVTVCCVVGNVVVNCMAGYALSRFEFPGRNGIFLVVLGSMMIPFQFILTPVYIRLADLKWNDHLIALIVPFLFSCLYIFMARQFFISIPKDLDEAARVDGRGYAGIFFRIILPNAGPLLTSIAILCFTGNWNSYLAPSTFMVTRENFTLAVGVKTVRDLMYVRMNLILCGVVILSVPILIVFLLLQKHFVEGVAASGIKG